MLETVRQLYKKHRQFILYGIIGGSGALLDLVLFLIFYNVFKLNPLLSTVLSTSAGIINNFIWNTVFNFKVKDKLHHRFLVFYAVGLFGLLLSVLIIYLLHDVLAVNANIAKIISIPIVVILQYFLNSKFSFGNIERFSRLLTIKNSLVLLIVLLVYALFICHSTYFGFSDEYDNILGGWLISHHGQLPYRDFFSHHMPLAYLISAVITLFTGNNVDAFRFVFVNGLFIWLLFIARRMWHTLGWAYALIFMVLVSASQYLNWSHMLLAETLIAYTVIHALLLLIFDLWKKPRPLTTKDVVVVMILGSIPVLSSLSYAFISILIYVTLALVYLRNDLNWNVNGLLRDKKRLCYYASLLALPYALFLVVIILSHSLHEFITQAYRFNSLYYSQFTNDVGKSFPSTLEHNVHTFFSNISTLLHLAPSGISTTVIATSSLVLLLLLLLWLLMARDYVLLVWLGLLFYFTTVRSSVMLDVFNQPPSRMVIYAFLVIFAATYALYLGLSQRRLKLGNESTMPLHGIMLLVAAFTIIAIFVKGINTDLVIYETKSGGTETGLQLNNNGGQLAEVINGLTSTKDYYWVGPIDFYTQLYIHAQRASSFTFFLPWQGVCPECSSTQLTDFTKHSPKVVYWQSGMQIFGANVDTYNKPLLDYLHENYVQLNDSRLQYFYFNKKGLPDTENKLRSMGYHV